MINVVLNAHQFRYPDAVDEVLGAFALMATLSDEPFDIPQVLENDTGDIILQFDLNEAPDMLVHELMHGISGLPGVWSFPNDVLTYGLLDDNGNLLSVTALPEPDFEDEGCDCPPGCCLIEDSFNS